MTLVIPAHHVAVINLLGIGAEHDDAWRDVVRRTGQDGLFGPLDAVD